MAILISLESGPRLKTLTVKEQHTNQVNKQSQATDDKYKDWVVQGFGSGKSLQRADQNR